jgi:hypothetical protein
MRRPGNTFTVIAVLLALIVTAGAALAAGGSGGSGGGGTTGGGGSATGGGGGGGGTKAACTNTLSLTAAATESLSGNQFSATYNLVSCQPRTHVAMTATDLSTGAVVWSSPDVIGTVAVWALPYKLTTYRIDARAIAGSTNTAVATASATVATLDALPCDVTLNETVTTGYWGIYPAIWTATSAQDCGMGLSVHLRIKNLDTGATSLDYPNVGTSAIVIDFEGPIVAYSAPYEIDADLVNSRGEVLKSATTTVVSSPLR